jgi:hypothetical protein
MTDGATHTKQDELALMRQLKDILLREDRTALGDVQRVLNEKALLAEKINPIVEDHLDFLRQNFPKEYTQVVNRVVEQKIKSSQQDILNVIYPVMGKMINKYIEFRFQELKEAINAQIQAMYSKVGFLWWIRNKIFGLDNASVMLANLDVPTVEEVFVVERDSGLLMGSAALYPTINRDVVAGMLTAIKSFVEDAFEREQEELELIQYGNYKIMIENFPTYYFALAIKGSVSHTEGGRFRNHIIDFIQETEWLYRYDFQTESQRRLETALDDQFIKPERERLNKLKIRTKG